MRNHESYGEPGMSEIEPPKDYPVRASDNRLAIIMQQVAGSLIVATIVALVSLGGNLWSRVGDHDNSIVRIESDQKRDNEAIWDEVHQLNEYMVTLKKYMEIVENRQREIQLELRENSANDRSFRTR